jgi:hypothetical protein
MIVVCGGMNTRLLFLLAEKRMSGNVCQPSNFIMSILVLVSYTYLEKYKYSSLVWYARKDVLENGCRSGKEKHVFLRRRRLMTDYTTKNNNFSLSVITSRKKFDELDETALTQRHTFFNTLTPVRRSQPESRTRVSLTSIYQRSHNNHLAHRHRIISFLSLRHAASFLGFRKCVRTQNGIGRMVKCAAIQTLGPLSLLKLSLL